MVTAALQGLARFRVEGLLLHLNLQVRGCLQLFGKALEPDYADAVPAPEPSVSELLDLAVAALGGVRRDGQHAMAEDLAQETFLLAYRNLKSFRQEAKFSTWLYRLTRHPVHNGLIISIALIMAGALGNILDSAFYGLIFNESGFSQVASLFPDDPESFFSPILYY